MSVVNNGDGTYDVTFDQPVTATGNASLSSYMYSPGSDGWYYLNAWTSTANPRVCSVGESNGDTDCTLIVFLFGFTDLTAAQAFPQAGPTFPV